MSHRIDNGWQSLVSFANGTVKFYEKTVTPPGYDGGGEIDITTMRNSTVRTRSPKTLYTVSNMTVTAAYDPAVYSNILSMLNINQQVTVTFPDASTVTFWGYINTFTPGELAEGAQPTATVEIIPTNHDNTSPLPLEQAPTFTGFT